MQQLTLFDIETGEDEPLDEDDLAIQQDPRIGRIGECMAELELLRAGWDVSRAAEGLPFDLIASRAGVAKTVQVKTKTNRKTSCMPGGGVIIGYYYKAGSPGDGRSMCEYAKSVDVLAFVGLTDDAVWFVRADVVTTKSKWINVKDIANPERRDMALVAALL